MSARLIILAVIVTLLGTVSGPSSAQSPFSAARFVNDNVISNYEVSQRIKLISALGLGTPPRALALEQLTDDRLKLAAAEDLGLTVTEEMRAEGLEQFAAARGFNAPAMVSRLRRAGVDTATLNTLVDVQILWRAVVNLRYRDRATPSDADVETALNAAAARAGESVFLREIAIPYAERGNAGARALAERIRKDVAAGASFAAFARQYSRTPSAAQGGALGWRPVERLPRQLAGQLLSMLPGDVTQPLDVPAGVILLQLANVRSNPNFDEGAASVSFVRLDLDAETAPAPVANGLIDCRDAEAKAAALGGSSGRVGPVPAGDLPADLALTISGLDRGETAVAQLGEDGPTVVLLCSRIANTNPETETQIREALFQRRMGDFSEGFLSELKADALIRTP